MEELCPTVARIQSLTTMRTSHWVIAFKTIDAAGWYLNRIFSALELFT